MAEQVNEGAYRISGRFGECFYVPPAGGYGQPMRLFEATQCTFTVAIAQQDVELAGNKVGTKDGPQTQTGTLVVQEIDAFFVNLFEYVAGSQTLEQRRAARDAGQRVPRTFTLQIWEDDPEALGALGYQLDGVRISQFDAGFNFANIVESRTHNYRFDTWRKIKAFERIGNQIDPNSGLPAVKYTDDLTTA